MFFTKCSILKRFFTDLSTIASVIASEKNIKTVQTRMKITRFCDSDSTLVKYKQLLTNYAYNKVRNEYEECNDTIPYNVPFITNEASCTCQFYIGMGLPCKHIFKFRRDAMCDLYDESLCIRRWWKEYLYASHPAYKGIDMNPNTIDHQIIGPGSSRLSKTSLNGELNKFKTVNKITKTICEKLSTALNDIFLHFVEKLQNIDHEIDDARADNGRERI